MAGLTRCVSDGDLTSTGDHLPEGRLSLLQKLETIVAPQRPSASPLTIVVVMKNCLVALVLVGLASALPGVRHRRDSFPFLFELPSDAELVLGGIQTGFDCANLPYGYYADEANNCAIYHVCLPYIDNNIVVTRHFSFMCGEGTVFDQEHLVCATPENASPCSQSSSFRRSNEYFGRTDIGFLEK
ncbi:U-scoloptoxin(01)-Cw1a-like 23 [Homarus americanus]|uniref:U-scoloptoxin(01)-Cw1a-like 23 n=2 Tax=Homarus americanus TaxID=6706 RepID=A0A8J5MKT2_HOMAM|nr:U-scoloptoxin(01)-Cw1a-like 23 [Homarus americanus]